MRFTKGKHAFVVATHTDRQHIHNHVIFNSTALDGTRKLRDFFFSALAVQRLSDLICLQESTCVNFHADWPLFLHSQCQLALENEMLRKYTILVMLYKFERERIYQLTTKDIPELKCAAGSKPYEDENEIR